MRVKIHIDGGARGNPGPAAAAVVIRSADDDTVIHEAGLFLGKATNNVAEYHGLLAGLEAAANLNATEAEVLSDSQLLVRQMNGRYKVRNEGLKPLHTRACQLAAKFASCTFTHVRREDNVHADELVNRALNLRRNVGSIE